MGVVCEKSKIDFVMCPPDWGHADPALEAATAGTLLGELVRITGGFDPKDRVWSRTTISCMLSGNIELGWAHMPAPVSSTPEKMLTAFYKSYPSIARSVWGELPEGGAEALFETFRGVKTADQLTDKQYRWINGWNAVSPTEAMQRIYTRVWFDRVVAPSIDLMRRKGWRAKRTLAMLVKMRNTSRTWLRRAEEKDSEAEVIGALASEYVAGASHRADDIQRIRTTPKLEGAIGAWPTPNDLKFSAFKSSVSPSWWKEATIVAAGVLLSLIFVVFTVIGIGIGKGGRRGR